MHLLRRPTAIFGAGVSGRGASGLIAALGGECVIYDRASDRPQLCEFGAAQAAGHGLVVLSPGFPPSHSWVQTARSAGCEVLGELDFAALAWPGEIIAITGTNGKTTLTAADARPPHGPHARAVGNVGTAFCDACARPGIAVCEVSSFERNAAVSMPQPPSGPIREIISSACTMGTSARSTWSSARHRFVFSALGAFGRK
jgi:UDP-N-acetylmuramoylalanine--D-glutamate ligase